MHAFLLLLFVICLLCYVWGRTCLAFPILMVVMLQALGPIAFLAWLSLLLVLVLVKEAVPRLRRMLLRSK